MTILNREAEDMPRTYVLIADSHGGLSARDHGYV